MGAISRSLGRSEQSYYRWRKEYGGLKVSQAKRLRDREKENQRLRKAVSDLTYAALRSVHQDNHVRRNSNLSAWNTLMGQVTMWARTT
ncbi:hypothetical protein DVR09_13155 [Erythrobacter aureus]|uniref:Transposase n=1 Tax=Erythrobacter aureus TaxID=2182384 RepID=A0A345YGU0_9SPHN|nr:hypothetical protein DVR09_13155 [Erythrobacter aureus]